MKYIFTSLVLIFIISGCGGSTNGIGNEQQAESTIPTNPPTQAPVPALEAGSTQVSPIDGMEMVYVPAGEFEMGSAEFSNEQPIHTVSLDAYWIDKYEVSGEMFALFVEDTGYQTDAEKAGLSYVLGVAGWDQVNGANWDHPQGLGSSLGGLETHPVVHVSWNDASAYCAWAGRRLPTEAEWEKVARGEDGRMYPWGEGIDSSLANYDYNIKGTTPVGSYLDGASPYGALDMAGNVWEWVADWYDENYYESSPNENPMGPSSSGDYMGLSGDFRALRGGSWYDYILHAANRMGRRPDASYDDIGFRCAVSP